MHRRAGDEDWLAFSMKRRKTVSVTPAMGARTVAGRPRRCRWRSWQARGCWAWRRDGRVPGSAECVQRFFIGDSCLDKCMQVKRPPRWRRPLRVAARPGVTSRRLPSGLAVGLGVLAAEALDAACGVDQLLLAGEERVAGGADFDDDVALVGGAGLKGRCRRRT